MWIFGRLRNPASFVDLRRDNLLRDTICYRADRPLGYLLDMAGIFRIGPAAIHTALIFCTTGTAPNTASFAGVGKWLFVSPQPVGQPMIE